MEKVSKLNFKFSPWSPELYEECMAKQRALFVRRISRSVIKPRVLCTDVLSRVGTLYTKPLLLTASFTRYWWPSIPTRTHRSDGP